MLQQTLEGGLDIIMRIEQVHSMLCIVSVNTGFFLIPQ